MRAAQKMQVQMENRLTRVLSRVEHGAKTFVSELKLLHECLDRLKKILENSRSRGGTLHICGVLLRNDENVDRRLGIDIAEGKNFLGLQYFLTGQTTVDNFAENAFALFFSDFHFSGPFWTDHLRSEPRFCQWPEFFLLRSQSKNRDQKLTALYALV